MTKDKDTGNTIDTKKMSESQSHLQAVHAYASAIELLVSDLHAMVAQHIVTVRSVSYTHLDVYKRQMHTCAWTRAQHEGVLFRLLL